MDPRSNLRVRHSANIKIVAGFVWDDAKGCICYYFKV